MREDLDADDDREWELVSGGLSMSGASAQPAPLQRARHSAVSEASSSDSYGRPYDDRPDLSESEVDAAAARLTSDPRFTEAKSHSEQRLAVENVFPEFKDRNGIWRVARAANLVRRPMLVAELAPRLAANESFRRAKGTAARLQVFVSVFPKYRDHGDQYLAPLVVEAAVEIVDDELAPVVRELKDSKLTNIAIAARYGITTKRVADLLARTTAPHA